MSPDDILTWAVYVHIDGLLWALWLKEKELANDSFCQTIVDLHNYNKNKIKKFYSKYKGSSLQISPQEMTENIHL